MGPGCCRTALVIAFAAILLGADGGMGEDAGAMKDGGSDAGWIEGSYRAEGCSCRHVGAPRRGPSPAPITFLKLIW